MVLSTEICTNLQNQVLRRYICHQCRLIGLKNSNRHSMSHFNGFVEDVMEFDIIKLKKVYFRYVSIQDRKILIYENGGFTIDFNIDSSSHYCLIFSISDSEIREDFLFKSKIALQNGITLDQFVNCTKEYFLIITA